MVNLTINNKKVQVPEGTNNSGSCCSGGHQDSDIVLLKRDK